LFTLFVDDGPRDGPDYNRMIDDYLRQYRQNIETIIKEMAKMAASLRQNLRTLEELQAAATDILTNLNRTSLSLLLSIFTSFPFRTITHTHTHSLSFSLFQRFTFITLL
jgi:hypothetical protein